MRSGKGEMVGESPPPLELEDEVGFALFVERWVCRSVLGGAGGGGDGDDGCGEGR